MEPPDNENTSHRETYFQRLYTEMRLTVRHILQDAQIQQANRTHYFFNSLN